MFVDCIRNFPISLYIKYYGCGIKYFSTIYDQKNLKYYLSIILFENFFFREREEITENNDTEDLILRMERDYFASINADMKERETKNAHIYQGFEEALRAINEGRLPGVNETKLGDTFST